MMKVELIWAQDRNRAIGRAGTMPWHVPEDLAHFKSTTMGAPVIMGRKTWESLPGAALPGRLNLVVSREPACLEAAGARALASLEEALRVARASQCERAFVIGGAQLYAQALAFADAVHVTELELETEAPDTFAPRLPECFVLREVSPARTSRTGVVFRFKYYERSPR